MAMVVYLVMHNTEESNESENRWIMEIKMTMKWKTSSNCGGAELNWCLEVRLTSRPSLRRVHHVI
jgi:hypothetical protein